MSRCNTAVLFVWIGIAALTAKVQAAPLTWTIDSDASFVRLTIPDQAVTFNGTTHTVRLRNANSGAWTDAGGRLAQVTGTIATNYADFASIEFLAGQHSIQALESGSFRPNPASFDPGDTNSNNPHGQYSDTGGAPAAYAARLNSNLLILIDQAIGFFAMRSVEYDLASGALAVDGAGNIAAGAHDFGILSAGMDFDGMSIVGIQPVPDLLAVPFGPAIAANSAGGLIEDLGGLDRRLTLDVDVPFSFSIEGVPFSGSLSGQIVATATIPEPATFVLAGMSAIAIAVVVRRRRRICR